MRLAKHAITAAATLLLAACATFEPVPKEYSGPTAILKDSGFYEDGSKAQIFAAIEIDGNRIGNGFQATSYASQGRGASLSLMLPERRLKTETIKITIKGSHATGAPIAAMASQLAGTFYSVEGIVDFKPQPGARYIVKGELAKEKSSVWIQDLETGKPVTAVITR